jgi:hypothetical protein
MSSSITSASQDLELKGKTSSASSGKAVIVGSSFLFAILQSICTVVVAINGIGIAIGAGSLAMSVGLGAALESFHQVTWLRVTFLVGALAGSLLTLALVLRARRLRARPASRWRIRPLTARQRRVEQWQLALSAASLLMVAVEEYLHFRLGHTL